jgi:hypothetical protein
MDGRMNEGLAAAAADNRDDVPCDLAEPYPEHDALLAVGKRVKSAAGKHLHRVGCVIVLAGILRPNSVLHSGLLPSYRAAARSSSRTARRVRAASSRRS